MVSQDFFPFCENLNFQRMEEACVRLNEMRVFSQKCEVSTFSTFSCEKSCVNFEAILASSFTMPANEKGPESRVQNNSRIR